MTTAGQLSFFLPFDKCECKGWSLLCTTKQATQTMENSSKRDNAGVVMFPPLLYVLTLGVGTGLSYLLQVDANPGLWVSIAGGALLALGFWPLVQAVSLFNKNNTTVNPAGSTRFIVRNGIYRQTRNPMYISFTLIYVGISVLSHGWLSFALLIPMLIVVHRGIVLREERYLEQKFGADYLTYKSEVPRWV